MDDFPASSLSRPDRPPLLMRWRCSNVDYKSLNPIAWSWNYKGDLLNQNSLLNLVMIKAESEGGFYLPCVFSIKINLLNYWIKWSN